MHPHKCTQTHTQAQIVFAISFSHEFYFIPSFCLFETEKSVIIVNKIEINTDELRKKNRKFSFLFDPGILASEVMIFSIK